MISNKKIISIASLSILIAILLMSFNKPMAVNFEQDLEGDTIKTPSFNANLEAYFGGCGNNANGGIMKKDVVLNNLKKDLCVKDLKTGNVLPIISFDFTYCERAVSEDELGIPIFTTDISFEEFNGQNISDRWKANLTEKLYKGDTIKFSNIKVRTAKGKERVKNVIIIPIAE